MKPAHDAFIASVSGGIGERFWRNVAKSTDGCWEWTGYIAPSGYGQFKAGRTLWAHRCAYVLSLGVVGDGLYLDHLCRNRRCVNPAHLEPVSARVNLLRGDTKAAQNAAKTHCDSGHALCGDNLRVWRGHRQCKACVRIAGRKHDTKRRESRNEQRRIQRAAAKHPASSAA